MFVYFLVSAIVLIGIIQAIRDTIVEKKIKKNLADSKDSSFLEQKLISYRSSVWYLRGREALDNRNYRESLSFFNKEAASISLLSFFCLSSCLPTFIKVVILQSLFFFIIFRYFSFFYKTN